MSTKSNSLFRALDHRDFRLLWGSQILSELGDWAGRLALGVLVLDRTGSKVLTAAVTGISLLPWVGLGQALAAFGERFPRRTMMIVSDLIRAVAFFAMIAVEPAWALLLLAFIAASATPPFEAARAAFLPEVVSEERYGDALALSNITYQVVLVLGYMAGGGLVVLAGAEGALAINAATFGLSALLLAFLSGGRFGRAAQAVGASIRAAARTIMGDPYLRRAAVLATIGASSAIVAEALVVVYVRENLSGSDAEIGLMAATVPLGTILASMLVRRHGKPDDLLRTSALVVLLGSAGGILWFLIEPPNYWAAAGFFSVGVVFAMVIPAYAVVGTRLPEDIRATAFGLLQGMLLGGQALASIIGGGVAVLVGPGPASAFALFPALGYAAFAFLVPPGGKLRIPWLAARDAGR
ncbi:MAG TPA: MFS transporter [Actinomycetota bacterium]|nr:MFS transporter [Actinomycetota bacterium]